MQTSLSFEPRYHELTCRDGRPVWVPMYNPLRECVSQESLQLRAAGCQVEGRLAMLPKLVRQAAVRTKRRERYARWAPVLEPVLSVGMALGVFSMLAHMTCLIGASLATAHDPVWFSGLSQLNAIAVSAAVGLPVIGALIGVMVLSWRACASSH